MTLRHDVNPADLPTGNTYDKYRVEHPIERRLVDGFLRALDQVLPRTSPKRVLEVGAGEGEISARVETARSSAICFAVRGRSSVTNS